MLRGSSPITPTSPSSKAHQKSGSFPPPALPGFNSRMTLSDFLPVPPPVATLRPLASRRVSPDYPNHLSDVPMTIAHLITRRANLTDSLTPPLKGSAHNPYASNPRQGWRGSFLYSALNHWYYSVAKRNHELLEINSRRSWIIWRPPKVQLLCANPRGPVCYQLYETRTACGRPNCRH